MRLRYICEYINSVVSSLFATFEARYTVILMPFFPGAVSYSQAPFGSGSGITWLERMDCVGTEDSLLNCSRGEMGINSQYCRYYYAAGVDCAIGEYCMQLVTVLLLRWER